MAYIQAYNYLSRECLFVSCRPEPSFADMVCRVGDMSMVMSATQRHCMSARVSKRHDLATCRRLYHKVIVVLAQTSCSICPQVKFGP